MRPTGSSRACLLAVLVSAGCASQRVVSVLSQNDLHGERRAPIAAPTVVVDATSVHLPMPVSGAAVAYSDVDRALEDAILGAASPVLEAHGQGRRYELFVELVEAHAEYSGGRLVVALTVRATLRDRTGNAYLGQTYARAAASRIVDPEQGGDEVRTAARSIGAKLAGFLLGLEL